MRGTVKRAGTVRVLDSPKLTAGSIRLNGRELTALAPQRRNMRYVPQKYALFPSLSVVQNVEFGLRRRIRSTSERRRTAREFLDFARRSALGLAGREATAPDDGRV